MPFADLQMTKPLFYFGFFRFLGKNNLGTRYWSFHPICLRQPWRLANKNIQDSNPLTRLGVWSSTINTPAFVNCQNSLCIHVFKSSILSYHQYANLLSCSLMPAQREAKLGSQLLPHVHFRLQFLIPRAEIPNFQGETRRIRVQFWSIWTVRLHLILSFFITGQGFVP